MDGWMDGRESPGCSEWSASFPGDDSWDAASEVRDYQFSSVLSRWRREEWLWPRVAPGLAAVGGIIIRVMGWVVVVVVVMMMLMIRCYYYEIY